MRLRNGSGRFMGHAKPTTTLGIYANVFEDDHSDAMAALGDGPAQSPALPTSYRCTANPSTAVARKTTTIAARRHNDRGTVFGSTRLAGDGPSI